MQSHLTRYRKTRGSSILEILTLIVILGLLAAVAFPIADRMNENMRNQAFLKDIRDISNAISRHAVERGGYPELREDGATPHGIEDFLEGFDWAAPTPFGGEWRWIRNQHGVRSAIAVHDPEVSEDHLKRFDQSEDDGDLHRGNYRFISDISYAYVLEDEENDEQE